jgi:hypothetical protein
MPFTQRQVQEVFRAWTEDPNVPLGLRSALTAILSKLTTEEPEMVKFRQKFLSAARELYQDSELEFDDDAPLSDSEGGQWVQCWKWISDAEAKVESMLLDPEVECCQLLYGAEGFVAKCSQEKGTEHEHSETAEAAVAHGLAVPVYDLEDELNGA